MATLTVTPWTDPIIDTLGHDPRSEYVERFWLPTLGPTTLLLLRRLATTFDRSPDAVTLDVADLSQSLGLGAREGSSSPLIRSVDRLIQFDLAVLMKPGHYVVRRNVPPINRRHMHRIPLALQREHEDWVDTQLGESPLEHARRRARRVAFALFEQREQLDQVEHTLLGIGFHPSVCRESAEWAHERHRLAFAALDDATNADTPNPDATNATAAPATSPEVGERITAA